ncbi:MAG TPA: hypothetical protein VF323_05390, partial [Candidatus Limnocylindrales bacterium]
GFAVSCDGGLADGGGARDFEGGSMFVAPGTNNAFALVTPLRDYWLSLGGPSGQLGYPTTNSAPDAKVPGAWSAGFQHGQGSFDPKTGGSSCLTGQCKLIIFNPSFPIFVINP